MHPIFDRTQELSTDQKITEIAKIYHDGGIDRQFAEIWMRQEGAFEAEINERLS